MLYDEIMMILSWLREKRGDVENLEDQAFQYMLTNLITKVDFEIHEHTEVGTEDPKSGPHTALFVMYLMAMCDLRNRDFESFKITHALFKDEWKDYATFYHKHRDELEAG